MQCVEGAYFGNLSARSFINSKWLVVGDLVNNGRRRQMLIAECRCTLHFLEGVEYKDIFCKIYAIFTFSSVQQVIISP